MKNTPELFRFPFKLGFEMAHFVGNVIINRLNNVLMSTILSDFIGFSVFSEL